MRIILLNFHLPLRKLPEVAEGVFGYWCFEDFSVGPLQAWGDQAAFHRSRSAFWSGTRALDLPDGEKMDHFFWHQVFPAFNWEDLETMTEADFPEPLEFDDVVAGAGIVELWADDSVQSHLWLWYMAAELTRLGIDRQRVLLRVFDKSETRNESKAFWNKLLTDAGGPDSGAASISEARWTHMLTCWQAAVAMPQAFDETAIPDAPSRHVLNLLAGRHPDATSGLNTLQKRLLLSGVPDWRKMARVIGDAMARGWEVGDNVGDAVLQAEFEAMARVTPALVEIEGSGPMRSCKVRLTEHGMALQTRLGA